MNGCEVILPEVNMTPETQNLLFPASHTRGLYELPHTKIYLLDEAKRVRIDIFWDSVDFI